MSKPLLSRWPIAVGVGIASLALGYACASRGGSASLVAGDVAQRVYVALAYTPLVVHFEGDALVDHCARPFARERAFIDDEGSILMLGTAGIALLDDRDLARFEAQAHGLPEIRSAAVPARFGYVKNPSP